ncbi:MAG: hypothetical protein LUE92_01665 [Clostridiales bacterium]|nr:hypothetical protein [Clostridiales bacterium]
MKLLEMIYLQIYSETETAKRLQREAFEKVTELTEKYEDSSPGNARIEDEFTEAAEKGLECGFLTGVRFFADLLLEIFECGEDKDGL